VWADLLAGFRDAGWHFPDVEHLRAFLVTATRNRFLNRARQHNRSLQHEQAFAEAAPSTAPDPSPSEVAQANELWQRLLALCPPAHRELLRLKRQGMPVGEIATRTGLHPSSVRRILYDLARRFAAG